MKNISISFDKEKQTLAKKSVYTYSNTIVILLKILIKNAQFTFRSNYGPVVSIKYIKQIAS
jgi:hypothetical protein